MTVDTEHTDRLVNGDGPLTSAPGWAAAFTTAG
jgi:hypothetical protein